MPPHRVPLATLVVVCLLVPAAAANACAGAKRPVAADLARAVRATHCLVDAARVRSGLPRLRDAGPLDRAAAEHARDMVRRDFFDHVSPGGSTPAQRVRSAGFSGTAVGETIAWSTGAVTPASIVRMWMRSPPHRKVLLAPIFSALGIGIARGAPGHGGSGATFTADLGG